MVSFIELGVGFNPELTGRENVYMNGAMLGFTTDEVDEMYDDIVEFAELADFMNQKLKNYSSGMQVRLAFSVAIKAQGDVLILDEVLAVGDEAFQRKCNDYFMERKKSGKTTILVTHDMGAVKKYCNKAVLIEDGLTKIIGNPDDVANQYSFDNASQSVNDAYDDSKNGEHDIQIVQDFKVKSLTNNKVAPDEDLVFEFTFNQIKAIDTHIAMSFVDIDSNYGYYNDNSMNVSISGTGEKKILYRCSLPYINRARLRLEATVRDVEKRVLAFASSAEAPIFFVERTDLSELDESAKDSATGLLLRNGEWTEKHS